MKASIKLVAVAVILIALTGVAFYKIRDANAKKNEAELRLGIAASRMINIGFQRRAQLTILNLSGNVVTSADCQGRIFHPTQRTKTPVSVAYTIDLKSIGPSSYRWSPHDRTLTIIIPDVQIEKPNVDTALQIVRQIGIFISRECGLVLARQSAVRSMEGADTEARKPENLKKAREAAREQIVSFASGILEAAHLPSVRVVVLLPGDKRSSANMERWDETRPLSEVLANAG